MITTTTLELVDELAAILEPHEATLREDARRSHGFMVNDGEGGGSGGGSGGEGGGGSGEGGAGAAGGGGSGEGGAGAGGSGGSGSAGTGEGGGSGSGGGDGTMTVSKKDWDGLHQQNRETAAALKKLQDADAERQRKADEEAGNHQAVAKREQEAREKAERERDEHADELKKERRTNRGNRIAGDLKFLDAADAVRLLDDPEVLDDDAKARKALEDLAKAKPHLLRGGTQRQTADVSGDGGGNNGTDVAGPARMAKAYGTQSS